MEHEPRELSKEELKELEKEMSAFIVTKKLGDRTLKYVDDIAFLKAKGALTSDGKVVVSVLGEPTRYVTYYAFLTDAMSQVRTHIAKREYAKRKGLEELEASNPSF